MEIYVTFAITAILLLHVGLIASYLILRARSLEHASDMRSLRAALERLGERAALVSTPTPGDPAGDIPDGIVHDEVREHIRRLARKWGSTPQMVLRCAVTYQIVRAWKDELEDTGPESGEKYLNVSTVPDDTGAMFEPGYAEEVCDEPTAAEDNEGDEEPVSERPLPRKPTKH